jgi:hypothetical protein
MDNWGEGYLLPVNDYREVELRNPQSTYIGLRGRRMLIGGRLPTILLREYEDNGKRTIAVKNAVSPFGARILELESGGSNEKRDANPKLAIFSGKINIFMDDSKNKTGGGLH